MKKFETVEVDINKLIPYAQNAKKHDKKQIKNVATSLKRFGWKQPIVITKDNVVVIGHCRLEAAKTLKMATVPCVIADDLSDVEIKELRIADNKTNESPWDEDMLKADIVGLQFEGFDFDFMKAEREVEEDDYDEAPPVEPKSKMGQVYKLGEHRLMVGDSTNAGDVKKLMDGELADMVLTDPPYNVAYKGSAGTIKNDDMGDKEFREFLVKAFTNVRDFLRVGGVFYIWYASVESYNFYGACRDVGLHVRQCLIWEKNALLLGRQDFQWIHEPCMFGEKRLGYPETEEYDDGDLNCIYGWVDGKHYWYKNRKQTTIMHFDKPVKSQMHPTMKPVKLFDYQMQCNTKEGDIVLDLFGGSGTTIVAAEQNGRRARLMEYDPKYADVIIDRWEALTGGKAELIKDVGISRERGVWRESAA